eukprot:Tbor_TRINITY_DN5844_c1_g3::TRINITY_DN5844_c1_g3_i1::g.6773::m.6773
MSFNHDEPGTPIYFPVSLSWKKINFRVDDKRILKNLSGCALPGRTLVIMGSSGAGKTTLLNALSDRLENNRRTKVLTGQIALNDVKYSHKHRRLLGFVPQDDIIGAMASPESAFHFAIRTRRGTSLKESGAIVNHMIEELRLTGCRDTRAGIPGISRGLSGGERKRTNIGVELIADTKVLLLDEPTSGLDSNTSEKVLGSLREIAQKGRTVVYTVHQPTSDMIQHMDDILLLTHGEAVYHGPMNQAENYFRVIGYPCPDTWTPTDHYMSLIQNEENCPKLIACWKAYLKAHNIDNSEDDSIEISQSNEKESKKEASKEMTDINKVTESGMGMVPDDIAEALPSVPKCLFPIDANLKATVENNATQRFLTEYLNTTGSSLDVQLYELTIRSFTFVWKNFMYLAISFVQTIVFSLLVSLIFANIKDTNTGIQDRAGLLFMLVMNKAFAWSSMTVQSFKPERAVFLREQQAGAYSPTIYFLTKWMAEVPLAVLNIAVESVIVYFVTGLYINPKNFFIFYAAMLFCAQTASSLGMLVGIAIVNDAAAASVLPMVSIPLMLTGGLLASVDQIRPYWYWIEKISYIRHAFIIVTHNELTSVGDISCDPAKFGASFCAMYPKTGTEAYAKVLKLDGDEDQPWVMWVSMAAVFIMLRLLGLVSLHVVSRGKF